jgi:hypothetical protein
MIALSSCLPRKVAGAAVGAIVAGLVLCDSRAHALIVNVGGQDYEVSTFAGWYDDNISKFETAANGGVMPWWGSQTNAEAFMLVVGTNLGMPNLGSPSVGPIFAYTAATSSSGSIVRGYALIPQPQSSASFAPTSPPTWAQATLVPAAGSANVPGPLPALGLAVAFGFSRQLRRRIKASGSNLPSASAQA